LSYPRLMMKEHIICSKLMIIKYFRSADKIIIQQKHFQAMILRL